MDPSPLSHDSPVRILAFLKARGLGLKKRFGQNFLISRGVREKLIGLLELRPGDSVWEIGPGLGAMTAGLLDAGCGVTAFEIDRGICSVLLERWGERSGFRLVEGDAAATCAEALQEGGPDLVCGNLPYSGAAKIISVFAASSCTARAFVFLVQREAAARMCARPGSPEYSSFSVLVQNAFEVKRAFDVRPGSFFPAPKVMSSAVVFRSRQDPCRLPVFPVLVEEAFRSRRKTLANNLSRSGVFGRLGTEGIAEFLTSSGLEPDLRAERLDHSAFARLARTLSDRFPGMFYGTLPADV